MPVERHTAIPQRQQLLVSSHGCALLAAGSPRPAGNGSSGSVPPPGSTDWSSGAACGAPGSWVSGDCTVLSCSEAPHGHWKSLPPRSCRKVGSAPLLQTHQPQPEEMLLLGCVHRLVPICRHEVTWTLILLSLLAAPSQALPVPSQQWWAVALLPCCPSRHCSLQLPSAAPRLFAGVLRADKQRRLLEVTRAPLQPCCTPSCQAAGWGELQRQSCSSGEQQSREIPLGRGYNRSAHILHVFLFPCESCCLILWHQPRDERIALNSTNPLILLCLQLEAFTYADITSPLLRGLFLI